MWGGSADAAWCSPLRKQVDEGDEVKDKEVAAKHPPAILTKPKQEPPSSDFMDYAPPQPVAQVGPACLRLAPQCGLHAIFLACLLSVAPFQQRATPGVLATEKRWSADYDPGTAVAGSGHCIGISSGMQGIVMWLCIVHNKGRAALGQEDEKDPFEGRVDGLYLVLISLHGLVRGERMELGKDPDTGGQVRAASLFRLLSRCKVLP